MESKDSGSSDASDRAVRLFVTGYDTSLPKDDVRSALIKHFSSSGTVFDVSVITGMSLVYLRGGPSVEKVEKLNGGCECHVEGGCKTVVDQVFPLNKLRKCLVYRYPVIPDFIIQRAMKLASKNAKRAKNADNANKAKNTKRAKKAKK